MARLLYQFLGAVLVLLHYAGFAAGQTRISDLDFDDLKGAVRTVIVRETMILRTDNGLKEDPRRHVVVSDYDQKGNKYLQRTYGAKPRATQYFLIKDRIVMVGHELKAPNELTDSLLLVLPTFAKPDNLTDQTMPQIKLAFDVKGRIAERTHYREDGRQSSKTTYAYDENGRLIEWRLVGPITGPATTTLRYDQSGILVESKQTNEIEQYTFTTTYSNHKLDSYGNWVERLERLVNESPGKSASQFPDTRRYRTITYYDKP